MSQDISFEFDEDHNTFRLFLNGNDQGLVDATMLEKDVIDLYLYFHLKDVGSSTVTEE